MSRRRYISTDISTDAKVNTLSTFAALLYTWALPHFADNCRITPQNAVEVKWTVVPARKEGVKEVERAIGEIIKAGLWGIDQDDHFFVPSKSFYKWQTYINAANRRETPQIAASPSPSPSPSPSLKEEEDIRAGKKQKTTFPEDFKPSDAVSQLATEKKWDPPQDQIEAFRDYHVSKGSRFLDWDAAFRTWLRNADQFKRNGRRGVQPKETPADRLRQRTRETLRRGLGDKEDV